MRIISSRVEDNPSLDATPKLLTVPKLSRSITDRKSVAYTKAYNNLAIAGLESNHPNWAVCIGTEPSYHTAV